MLLIFITYEEEGVLNGGLVVHRSEIVLFDLQDHKLFKELITHKELLGGTWDVSVVVEDSHTGISSNLNLKSQVSLHGDVDIGLLGREDTDAIGTSEVIEAFVSEFINHLNIYII